MKEGLGDHRAVGFFHVKPVEDLDGCFEAFFDFLETVGEATGLDEKFSDRDKVLIIFFRLIEILDKQFSPFRIKIFIRMADQKRFFRFGQVA